MTVKLSTGFRNSLLDTGSVKSLMDGGFIKIYAGTEPVDPDAALGSATLLCTISDNGGVGGLTMAAAAVNAVLSKLSSQVWKGTNVAGGQATFFRWVLTGDTGASSSTEKRIQGTVALAGSDMNLSNTVLVNGVEQTLDYFNLAIPVAGS